jgi:hypothetical protein
MLNIDPNVSIKTLDWLLMPQQQLLELTSSEVYRDDEGELTRLRKTLEWYPRDIWMLIMAAQWKRISQEEPFIGRCAEAWGQSRLAHHCRQVGARPNSSQFFDRTTLCSDIASG